MSTLVRCPRCRKPFRVGEDAPASFACTKCGQVLDLSSHVGATSGGESATAAASPSGRKNPKLIALYAVCLVVGGVLGVFLYSWLDGLTFSNSGDDAIDRAQQHLLGEQGAGEASKALRARSEMDAATERAETLMARLVVDSPRAGEVVHGDTVHVIGTLKEGSPTDVVLVNRHEVRRGPGSFDVSVPLVWGANAIEVGMTIDGRAVSRRLDVTRTK